MNSKLTLIALTLILFSFAYAQSNRPFKIESQKSNTIRLRFETPELQISPINDSNGFSQLTMKQSQPSAEDGKPMLPAFSTTIIIPPVGDFEISLSEGEYRNYENIVPSPVFSTESKATLKEYDRDLYNSDKVYPAKLIEYSEPSIIRDFRVVHITVNPVQWHAGTKQLRYYKDLSISITFNSNSSVNEMNDYIDYSKSFEKLYSSALENFNDFRESDSGPVHERILLIYGNSTVSEFTSALNNFIAWKRQKGFDVNAISTTQINPTVTTTTIKNYIQSQYDNLSTRPDYVILLGDTNGTYSIPTFTENVSGYSGEGDYPYTFLAGNDQLGDVMIGRISAENLDQMLILFNKVYSYEKNVSTDAVSSAWLNRMMLVGDPSSSGISTQYVNEFIKELSIEENPMYTFIENYSGGYSGTMTSAVNQGIAFFNYRGFINMSGWSPSSSLVNGAKLPHATILTCATGNFENTTSTTESFVRLGTQSTPAGAITAIGMATSGTHTMFNNCLNGGVYDGIMTQGMRNMGTAMLNAKLYLNTTYAATNPNQVSYFSHWCNLMGDPTVEVWVGIPKVLVIQSPTSIPLGTSIYDTYVYDEYNHPVNEVSVTVFSTTQSQIVAKGFTNGSGLCTVVLPATLTGELIVTVSKHDYKPTQQTVIVSGSGSLVYNALTITDNGSSGSVGNANGVANAGETIALNVNIRNTTAATITGINGVLSTTDPMVSIIQSLSSYNSVVSQGIVSNSTPFRIVFNTNIEPTHDTRFTLSLTSAGGTIYTALFHLNSFNAALQFSSISVSAGGNSILDPSESGSLQITIVNDSSFGVNNINSVLTSNNYQVVVTDSTSSFGNFGSNSTLTSADGYRLIANSLLLPGMQIPMTLKLFNANGFEQTIAFNIPIGSVNQHTPLGPDAHGYFIYDVTDVSYQDCPTYQWVEINPSLGGSGTLITGFSDAGVSGDEGDQVGAVSIQVLDLPFPFKFYGIDYQQISVCVNGFIAMGASANAEFRNYRLPGAMGPSPMIAPFWDDLIMINDAGIYKYYNSTNHTYTIQYHRMRNGFDRTSIETFEVIFYDQAYYPTGSGDGIVKIQYLTFNNIDTGSTGYTPTHGNYCTIGIKDHTNTQGLEYSYNNTYPTAAYPISAGSALLISTRPLPPDSPFIEVQNISIYDLNENNHMEAGEVADLVLEIRNTGFATASNVRATLSSADPFVSILEGNCSFGNISPQTSSTSTNFGISIENNCPSGHVIPMVFTITSNEDTWSEDFTITVYAPEISFGTHTLTDSGDHDGILDPGETALIAMTLFNSSQVSSQAGSSTMITTTNGITIVNGASSFGPIPSGESVVLNFSLTASSSIAIGTMVQLSFSATAGPLSASNSINIEVGAPLEVIIGGGSSTQSYPIDRYYNYSAHESIYLSSEFSNVGNIKSLGFYKASGNNQDGIADVWIYLKNTSETSLISGVYSINGYTQVYHGVFPNTSQSGWMDVDLDEWYYYDGTSNLAVLIVKGYQQYINDYPTWAYTQTTINRSRFNRSDSQAPTTLNPSTNLPNIRFKIFPQGEVLSPPRNLTAVPKNKRVELSWEVPSSGSPQSYNIYRNTTFICNVDELSYTDMSLINGVSYSYYLTAVYDTEESTISNTVTSTPIASAPTNFQLVTGNHIVSLLWESPTNDTPITYNIYRNGTLIYTDNVLTYHDIDVVNGTSYSYYVIASYGTEMSSPTVTLTATPGVSISSAIIGNGNVTSLNNYASPINITYKSSHGQSVYTATELMAAGLSAGSTITQLGFNIVTPPDLPLPNFIIRMKHTVDSNVSVWQSGGLTTVYSSVSYMPTAGGYDLLNLSVPFVWNGADNLLVDTAFNLVSEWTNTGTIVYTDVDNGYRYTWNDYNDQTNIFSGGGLVTRRPNIKLTLQQSQGAQIITQSTSLSMGSIEVGQTATQQFTLQNTGDQTLAGYMTSPAGYTITDGGRSSSVGEMMMSQDQTRYTLRFDIPAGSSEIFTVTFAPQADMTYTGNIVITSNSITNPTYNIALSGSGYSPSLDTPVLSLTTFGTSVQLQWSTVPNATQYQIYKSDTPTGPFTLLNTVTNPAYIDSSSSKAFYYIVAIRQNPAK